MRMTFVGTGTAVPEPERACSGYWLEAGGARLLLDCGPGVVHSLARLQLPWAELTHLVLTHFHNDHTGDVPFLFFALHYGLRVPRRNPLVVLGPAGTRKLLRRMGRAFGSHLRRPAFEVEVRELSTGEEVALPGGAELRCQLTPHAEPSLAYRVAYDGESIGYTGDTGESEELGQFMKGVSVLVAECSLPEELAMDSHLTPVRLARLARAAEPGLLAVTHIYPQLDRASLPAAVQRAGWSGPLVVARDGLVLP
jgi:ribonuclease BN (tRNA processing enzyme)